MWEFSTALDALQLPSSEMKVLPHFLSTLFSLAVGTGKACAKAEMLEADLLVAAIEATAAPERGVVRTVKSDAVGGKLDTERTEIRA